MACHRGISQPKRLHRAGGTHVCQAFATSGRTALPAGPPRNSRLKQLDGLRGLAALAVFVCHSTEMMVNNPNTLRVWPPLRSLWDGQAAVVLFFVLSGFVLTLPYVGPSPKRVDTAPFIVRRLTRLYPAYWTAILLALFFSLRSL